MKHLLVFHLLFSAMSIRLSLTPHATPHIPASWTWDKFSLKSPDVWRARSLWAARGDGSHPPRDYLLCNGWFIDYMFINFNTNKITNGNSYSVLYYLPSCELVWLIELLIKMMIYTWKLSIFSKGIACRKAYKL